MGLGSSSRIWDMNSLLLISLGHLGRRPRRPRLATWLPFMDNERNDIHSTKSCVRLAKGEAFSRRRGAARKAVSSDWSQVSILDDSPRIPQVPHTPAGSPDSLEAAMHAWGPRHFEPSRMGRSFLPPASMARSRDDDDLRAPIEL